MLVVLIFGNYLCSYLGWAAGGGLQASMVLRLLNFLMPNILLLLLPVSFFLALLLVYGKLFHTNELWAAFASGLSWRRLLLYSLVPGVFLSVLSFLLSFYVVPVSLNRLDALLNRATAKSIALMQPGQFYAVDINTHQMAYIPASDRKMGSVPFLSVQMGEPITVMYANDSQVYAGEKSAYLALQKGWIQHFSMTSQQSSIIYFQQAQRWIRAPVSTPLLDISAVDSLALWHAHYRSHNAVVELRWRLAVGLLPIVVVFFALLFCKRAPRKGRFYRLPTAVISFVLYCNVLSFMRSELLQADWPSVVGFEVLNVLLVGVGFLCLCAWDGVLLRDTHV